MLVTYEFNGGAQDTQVIDIGSVRVQSAGEGAWLMAGCLVGVVEDVFERWVGGEQVGVEFCGDGVSVFGEDGDGGFYDLGLGGCKGWHVVWEGRVWRDGTCGFVRRKSFCLETTCR
jgi:hypothetical protein